PIEAVAHGREVAFAGDLRKAVPRARELAVVATVDTIADERTQVFRDCIRQFDGQVRDAPPRNEFVGRDDWAGGTRADARGAIAAVAGHRFRYGQRQVGIDLAQEEIRAHVTREQQRVL